MANINQDADKSVNEQVESVMRAHAGDVAGILIRMGFPRDVALSAVNDAALALALQRKRGVNVTSPKAFLVKVATYRALNELRSTRATNEVPDANVTSDMLGRTDDFTVAMMVQTDVRSGLGQLTQRQRESLTLCDLMGLSCEEAAEHMGMSADGVESSLRRARKRLKEIMIEQGYEPRKRDQADRPGKEAER